jgi:hypothetical protein
VSFHYPTNCRNCEIRLDSESARQELRYEINVPPDLDIDVIYSATFVTTFTQKTPFGTTQRTVQESYFYQVYIEIAKTMH